MTIRNARSQVTAAILITILPLALAPAFGASEGGAIHGIVLEAGNHAPMPGIKVHVADPATGVIQVSGMTGDDGIFTVTDLPAATYEIGLEKEGRLFLVQAPVPLAPGQNRNLAVALDENAKPEEDEDDTELSVWQNPLTAALLVTGGAVAGGLLLENATDSRRVISPSNIDSVN